MPRSPRSAAQHPSLRRRLELELLEGRELPSVTVMESEPNDNRAFADAFVFPTNDGLARLRGRVANSGDNDFFKFTVRASTGLSVDVRSTSGAVPTLEVQDQQGNRILVTDPSSGVNTGSVDLLAGRTYFIRLKTQNTQAAAVYDVALALDIPTAGGGGTSGGTARYRESEPNNTRSTADAFRIVSNGVSQLIGTSLNREERDFFVFTPTQSGVLSFVVRSTSGASAQLEVQNARGETLFETDPNSGNNLGSVAVTAGQQYFIRLRAVGNLTANYEASLSLTV